VGGNLIKSKAIGRGESAQICQANCWGGQKKRREKGTQEWEPIERAPVGVEIITVNVSNALVYKCKQCIALLGEILFGLVTSQGTPGEVVQEAHHSMPKAFLPCKEAISEKAYRVMTGGLWAY